MGTLSSKCRLSITMTTTQVTSPPPASRYRLLHEGRGAHDGTATTERRHVAVYASSAQHPAPSSRQSLQRHHATSTSPPEISASVSSAPASGLSSSEAAGSSVTSSSAALSAHPSSPGSSVPSSSAALSAHPSSPGSSVPSSAGSSVPPSAGSSVPLSAGSSVPSSAGSSVPPSAGSSVPSSAGLSVSSSAGSSAHPSYPGSSAHPSYPGSSAHPSYPGSSTATSPSSSAHPSSFSSSAHPSSLNSSATSSSSSSAHPSSHSSSSQPSTPRSSTTPSPSTSATLSLRSSTNSSSSSHPASPDPVFLNAEKSCVESTTRGGSGDTDLDQKPRRQLRMMVRCGSRFQCRLPHDVYKDRLQQTPCRYKTAPGVPRCGVCHSPLPASPLTFTATATTTARRSEDRVAVFMEVMTGKVLTKVKVLGEVKAADERRERMLGAIRDYRERREGEKRALSFSSIASSSSPGGGRVSRCPAELRPTAQRRSKFRVYIPRTTLEW